MHAFLHPPFVSRLMLMAIRCLRRGREVDACALVPRAPLAEERAIPAVPLSDLQALPCGLR